MKLPTMMMMIIFIVAILRSQIFLVGDETCDVCSVQHYFSNDENSKLQIPNSKFPAKDAVSRHFSFRRPLYYHAPKSGMLIADIANPMQGLLRVACTLKEVLRSKENCAVGSISEREIKESALIDCLLRC
jgi:hypothetical protein